MLLRWRVFSSIILISKLATFFGGDLPTERGIRGVDGCSAGFDEVGDVL